MDAIAGDIFPLRLLPGAADFSGLDRLADQRWNAPEIAILSRLAAFPPSTSFGGTSASPQDALLAK